MLFDFQQEFVFDIGKGFKHYRKVLAVLATGGGKSYVMAEIARRSILKGNVPLIACHRQEIFQQLYSSLKTFGIQPALIVPGVNPMPGHACYLGMVETVCRRMTHGITEKLNINFLICDEAHYGSYTKLIQQHPEIHLLGFTATPKSTGKPELNELYETIVESIKVSELIKMGRLVKATTFSINHDFSKVKMKGKDFDDKSLFAEFKKPKLWNGAVEKYMEVAKGERFICYNINVEQSLEVCRQFRDHGIKAAHVDANSEDRESIFKMYERGELDGICNVGIATTGYDSQTTQCIIQNFATASIVKDVQTKGRGARCYDETRDPNNLIEGKDHFKIIDMGRNWSRFGTFGEDIDWLDIFNHPNKGTKKDSSKQKTNRECDSCGMVIAFRLQRCPYCDHIISKNELESKLMEGATLEEIREYRHQNLPVNLRKHPSELNHKERVDFGRLMGYKPSWAHVMANVFKNKT